MQTVLAIINESLGDKPLTPGQNGLPDIPPWFLSQPGSSHASTTQQIMALMQDEALLRQTLDNAMVQKLMLQPGMDQVVSSFPICVPRFI